jgi:pimeloyl-ACP methyl ester carboxylesterase
MTNFSSCKYRSGVVAPIAKLIVWIAAFFMIGAMAQAQGVAVPGTQLERREVKDELGRTVTYYIGHPRKSSAPILLMIQGSGCMPVMNIKQTGSYSTLFDLLPLAAEGQFTVMAVEKPFSGASSREQQGTSQSCSAAFNEDFTAERWLVAIQASLKDARESPWVARERALVLGISEGAVMAALLAGRDALVTDVVSIGGSGTTQLFDFVALAYQRCFDKLPCLHDIQSQVHAINADSSSSTKFAWGHPYKRWTSFFHVDPAEALLRSKARVYLAFGTNDESVPPLSQEIAVAKLMVAQRELTVRRVTNAGHNLTQSGNPDWTDLDKEIRAALAWFWDSAATDGRDRARQH